MRKPKLLDLFCGAGGAGMGYHRAGVDVTGVDIIQQVHYPFKFICADAIQYAAAYGWQYDVIHASPPCQVHSQITPNKKDHEDFIPATRFILQALGKPYIIENVGGARKALRNPFMLCGADFGLKVYRHRFFESNILILVPPHIPHRDKTPPAGHGISPKGFLSITSGGQGITKKQIEQFLSPKGFVSVAGHFSQIDYARYAMGIDWMPQGELSQAIPPAFTEFIGTHMMNFVLDDRSE